MKSLLKDTAVYGLGDFAFKLMAFAVIPVYAHVFSVEEFGAMTLIVTLSGLVGMIASLGLNQSVQRFYWDRKTNEEIRPRIVSSGFWVLVLWAMLVSGSLLLIFYFFQDTLLDRFGLVWIWLILAIVGVVPGQILQYAQDVLRLHFSPWKYSLVSACKNAVGVGLGLFFILALDWGLTGYFWGTFCALALAVPLALWLIRKDLRLAIDLRWKKELARFGYPFIFAGLAYWIFTSSDRWMLGILSDNVQVGLYGMGFYLAGILLFVNQAFGMAWSPFAIRLYADDPDYRQTYGKILSSWLFALALIGGGITLFSSEILHLLTPAEYWGAADFVGLLMVGAVFAGTTQITALGISLEKKTKLIFHASWMAASLNVILNFLLIPKLGATGAALATCLSQGFITGFYLYWTQRLHPIPLEIKKMVFSIAIMLLLVFPFPFYKFEGALAVTIFKMMFCGLFIASGFALEIIKISDLFKWTQRKSI